MSLGSRVQFLTLSNTQILSENVKLLKPISSSKSPSMHGWKNQPLQNRSATQWEIRLLQLLSLFFFFFQCFYFQHHLIRLKWEFLMHYFVGQIYIFHTLLNEKHSSEVLLVQSHFCCRQVMWLHSSSLLSSGTLT